MTMTDILFAHVKTAGKVLTVMSQYRALEIARLEDALMVKILNIARTVQKISLAESANM